MSTAVFPVLNGQGLPVERTPMWSTSVQRAVSGKRTAIAFWTYPIYKWSLTMNYLRAAAAFGELQALEGFFNNRKGAFDSFLWNDADDNAVTSQALGVGDGVKTTFQLQRTFGGFTMPVLAPNTVSHVKVNGVDGGGWSVTSWGSATPGLVTLPAPAPNGQSVTADFSFYFPCEFLADDLTFSKFLAQIYSAKTVEFQSIK